MKFRLLVAMSVIALAPASAQLIAMGEVVASGSGSGVEMEGLNETLLRLIACYEAEITNKGKQSRRATDAEFTNLKEALRPTKIPPTYQAFEGPFMHYLTPGSDDDRSDEERREQLSCSLVGMGVPEDHCSALCTVLQDATVSAAIAALRQLNEERRKNR